MLLALLLIAQTAPAMPGEVHLVIPRRGCRVLLGGQPVALGALRDRLQPLSGATTEIHFQPDPRASYRCVDKVMAILKAVPYALKLGLIGNDVYGPEDKQ